MLPKRIKSKQNQVARFQMQRDARKAQLLAQGVSEDRVKKDSVLRHLHAEIRRANHVIADHETMVKAAEKLKEELAAKRAKAKEPKAKEPKGKEAKGKAPKGEAKAKGEKPPKQKKPKEPKPEAPAAEAKAPEAAAPEAKAE